MTAIRHNNMGRQVAIYIYTGMRGIMTYQSTTNNKYDGGPIRL